LVVAVPPTCSIGGADVIRCEEKVPELLSRKKPLFLDADAVHEVANIRWPRRPRGIDGLIGDWAARSEEDSGFPQVKTRSTIYDWLATGAPTETEGILALAAILDVDPLSIFDFERNGYFDDFSRLREQVYFHIVGGGRYRSILDLMAPRTSWPNDGLALKYFRRSWVAYEFEHRARDHVNQYADVKVSFSSSTLFAPRVAHIAYRRALSRDRLWRYYGTLIQFRNRTRLFSESGAYVESIDENSNQSGFTFKTYFGATHVEFRLAALHEFEYSLTVPSVSGSQFLFEPDPRH
jgi:hypothetical protein